RQVQVVGCRQVEPAAGIGGAERRVQESGLATVVDRETGVGPVENRNVPDLQAHMPGGAETFSPVEDDLGSHQRPVVTTGGTGGQGTSGNLNLVLTDTGQGTGGTPHLRAMQQEGRGIDVETAA